MAKGKKTIIKEIKKDITSIDQKGSNLSKGPKIKLSTGSRKLRTPINYHP